MSNCHTCYWSDRDPKTDEQVIYKEPDFLDQNINPVTGQVPDIRIVKSCGRGAFYYKTYGKQDHDCKKWEDNTKAEAEEAAAEAEIAKSWDTPTSRAKLTKTDNTLILIEEIGEGDLEATNILFDVMGMHFPQLGGLIKNLDDMNIRGKQIPIAFEVMGSDLEQLILAAQDRSVIMVNRVNRDYDNVSKEEAVQSGAAKYGHGPAKKRVIPKPRIMKMQKFKRLRQKGGVAVKRNPHVG